MNINIELTVYFIVFIGAQLYSLLQFSLQGQSHLGKLLLEVPEDFEVDCISSWLPSWTCHQPVDVSDDEWRVAREFYLTGKVAYLLGHCLGWAVVRRFSRRHLPHFTILYSLFCLANILGPIPFLLFCANIAISFALNFLVQRQRLQSNIPRYLLFVICLVANNLYHADGQNFEVNLLFNLSVSWLNAKLLSLSLDGNLQKPSNDLLRHKLAYLLYFPSLLFGPIYHFADFSKSLDSLIISKKHSSSFKLPFRLLRTFFCALLFDLLLKRYLYSSAYLHYPHYFTSRSFLSAWGVAGFGFSLMLLFFLKYRILYGVSQAVAEEVDGLEGVFAPPPQCIAHMSTTSYLWRHFDQGLYAFLFKYFYAPLTGSRGASPWRKALASSVCFAAIALWHEQLTSPAILIWVLLNFALLNAEQAGKFLLKTLKSSNLTSENNLNRLKSLAGAPYLLLAYLSNILFLSNIETVSAILGRLFDSPTFSLTLLVILYTGCHVCRLVNQR